LRTDCQTGLALIDTRDWDIALDIVDSRGRGSKVETVGSRSSEQRDTRF